MSRQPKTGMERLLRLRDLQIDRARGEHCQAAAALQQAESKRHHALAGLAAVSSARHSVQAQATLDLGRYHQLVESERWAAAYSAECEGASQRCRDVANASEAALAQRLRQGKAVEQRHNTLGRSLRQALEGRQELQLTELWLNQRGAR